MNAETNQNDYATAICNATRCPLLNRNELASGQSDSGSGTGNGRTQTLLANTGENQAAKTKTRRSKKKKMTKLQELRAKSPFKTVAEQKGRSRKGNTSSFGGTAINRKLNQERAECRSIEFQLKHTFGI